MWDIELVLRTLWFQRAQEMASWWSQVEPHVHAAPGFLSQNHQPCGQAGLSQWGSSAALPHQHTPACWRSCTKTGQLAGMAQCSASWRLPCATCSFFREQASHKPELQGPEKVCSSSLMLLLPTTWAPGLSSSQVHLLGWEDTGRALSLTSSPSRGLRTSLSWTRWSGLEVAAAHQRKRAKGTHIYLGERSLGLRAGT